MNRIAIFHRLSTPRLRLPALSLLVGALLALVVAQTAFGAYVRPKGATPKLDSLVIAYKPCGAPNQTHSAPFAYPSCNPPVQTSPWLTVGTPPANGLPPNFIGSTLLKVCLPPGGCAPGPPGADIHFTFSMTDIRCTAALAGVTPAVCPGGALGPYTGSVQPKLPLQITDMCNSPAGPPPCTPLPPAPNDATGPAGAPLVVPMPPAGVPCALAGPGIGSTCAVATTFNAVIPGSIVAGAKANIEIGLVTVTDGGSKGDFSTPASLFADAGVFVP
jgi:hypothetical protein